MRKIRTTPAGHKQNVAAPPSQHPPTRRTSTATRPSGCAHTSSPDLAREPFWDDRTKIWYCPDCRIVYDYDGEGTFSPTDRSLEAELLLHSLRQEKTAAQTQMRALVAADKEKSRQQIEERSRTSVIALELGERGWVRLFVEERVAGPTSYHPEHGGEYRIGLSVEDIATGEDLDLTDDEVKTLEAALDD